MSDTSDTATVVNDTDPRVYAAAVSRVRLARDRAIDLADAIVRRLQETSDEGGNVGAIESLDIEEWREQIDRLARMAERSDIWLRQQPTA